MRRQRIATVGLAVAVAAGVASQAGCGRVGPGPGQGPRPAASAAAPRATTTADGAAATGGSSRPGRPGRALDGLGLTGAGWEPRLAALSPARARAEAVAFLREGELRCLQLEEHEVGCGDVEQVFAPVDPAADLDDPCLRRRVARWALTRLEATDVHAVADALAAIVALPAPERELADEVVALVPPGDDALRLRLIEAALAAGRADVADLLVAGLTPGGAAVAVVDLGREAAIAHLGPAPAAGTLAAALARAPSPAAALQLLDAATAASLDDPALAAAVRTAAGDDDCAVAARAAVLLDAAGDDQYLPHRLPLRGEADATRALCVARHVSPEEAMTVVWSLVATDGLELAVTERRLWVEPDEPDPDLDGDGDPATSSTRERIEPDALDARAAELVEAWLPLACHGGTCFAAGGVVTLGFASGAGRGLQLVEIAVARHEEGCGC